MADFTEDDCDGEEVRNLKIAGRKLETEIERLRGLIDRISDVAHDSKKFPVNAIAEIQEIVNYD